MILQANAKINLGLAVLDQRPDGYHDISTVMQSINLFDTVRMEKAQAGGITLTCSEGSLPVDERNLAYRGAALLMKEAGIRSGLTIHIEKGIPMEAGMAGGSADGAAALVGVNELFSLGLSTPELCALGVKLGADVPFCLQGGTMLCEGIGEIMTPVDPLWACTILIAKPRDRVSTAEAYHGLAPRGERKQIETALVLAALREQSLEALGRAMENAFEPGVLLGHPVVGELLSAMRGAGAKACRMSGSGPTVFGLFEREETARAARQELEGRFPDTFLALTGPATAGIICMPEKEA